MRLRLGLLALLFLAACDTSSDIEEHDASMNVCGEGCGTGCASGERCFGGGSPAALYSFAQRCARICTSDDDCAAGTVCIHAVSETAGPVCLPPQAPPASCGSIDLCGGGDLCYDSMHLSRHSASWCGGEIVKCAKGCVEGSGDGGMSGACAP